jgi:hypothetical protein
MEEVESQAFNQQKVVYQPVPAQGTGSKMVTPPPVPQPLYFKPRDYSSLSGNPEHILELKQELLKRLKDPDRIKQFKEEIEKLKNKLSNKKVSD